MIEQYLEPQPSTSLSTTPLAAESTSTSSAASATATPSPSDLSDLSDPDFLPPEPKVAKKSEEITIKLNKDKWIRDLHLQNRRGKQTPSDVFRFCATTIQSGGGDLASFPLSAEGIRLKGIELDEEFANLIRVSYEFWKYK